MADRFSPDFWNYYDKASDLAQYKSEWLELEAKVNAYLNKAPNSNELQEDLVNYIDRQYIILMSEMFKLLKMSNFILLNDDNSFS